MSLKIISFFLILYVSVSFGQDARDSVAMRLEKAMNRRTEFIAGKERKIAALKEMLKIGSLTLQQTYEVNEKLYNEYKKYQSDSAKLFVLKNKIIAKRLKDQRLINNADVQLAGLYSTGGLYIESKELLNAIKRSTLSADLLPSYFDSWISFCSNYGQSNNYDIYYYKSELYRDSLLAVLSPGSLNYKIAYATKILYQGKKKEAEKLLLKLLDKTSDKNTERAVIAYLLGRIYKEDGRKDLQRRYFSISAITDIQLSIKDNASMQSLALTYFESGDVDRAFKFIETAINDAVFCNVRYRTLEGSSFYPIINAAYQEKEKKQNHQLRLYLALISILTVFLIIGIVYIYKQMQRLSKIRKELYFTNQKLSDLNNDLSQANDNLSESNHIKEEYIAHFFDLCSTYIDKLENYRKSLHKKVVNKQIEELYQALKSTNIVETEVEELYKNFDTIFLNLYPSFVKDFNNLLLPDEHVLLRHGEFLNTELRIFALIRLGITDSIKIASFLRYSLRTVYNYRTKMRNKAAVSRDEFEERVKEIGTLTRNP